MNNLIDEKKDSLEFRIFLHIYWDIPSYISLMLRYNRKDIFEEKSMLFTILLALYRR